jgi:hypothetical protein
MKNVSAPNATARPGVAMYAAIGAAGVVLGLAFAGWLAYGGDIYMTLIDSVIAWCM